MEYTTPDGRTLGAKTITGVERDRCKYYYHITPTDNPWYTVREDCLEWFTTHSKRKWLAEIAVMRRAYERETDRYHRHNLAYTIYRLEEYLATELPVTY